MDNATLYRLLAWLSPGYPVGGFAYSHGIEWAVEDGRVTDEATLGRWVADVVELGSGRTDAILCRRTYAAAKASDMTELAEVNEIALALAPGGERLLETSAQGTAFLSTTAGAWPWPGVAETIDLLGGSIAYPVAVAVAAAGHGIELQPTMLGYLHAFSANLVSAGVRLIPLGQSAGQRTLAALSGPVQAAVEAAMAADPDDVGGACVLSDITSLRHETQYTRLFRS